MFTEYFAFRRLPHVQIGQEISLSPQHDAAELCLLGLQHRTSLNSHQFVSSKTFFHRKCYRLSCNEKQITSKLRLVTRKLRGNEGYGELKVSKSDKDHKSSEIQSMARRLMLTFLHHKFKSQLLCS